MEEESRLTVEQLQLGDVSLFAIAGVLESLAVLMLLLSSLVAFLSLRSAARRAGRPGLSLIAYGFGLFFLSLVLPVALTAAVWFVPDIGNYVEAEVGTLFSAVMVFVSAVMFVLGSLKLRGSSDAV